MAPGDLVRGAGEDPVRVTFRLGDVGAQDGWVMPGDLLGLLLCLDGEMRALVLDGALGRPVWVWSRRLRGC